MTYLQQRHPVPDYELLLSQLAAAEQDSISYKQHISRFMAAVDNPLYGGMYNIYQAGGENEMARKYLLAAKESAFELGPVMNGQLNESLKALN